VTRGGRPGPLALVLLACAAAPAGAQHPARHAAHAAAASPDSVAAFVARAREGTGRYADRAVAIADGYRRVGQDFPAMGEHWAHPGLVFAGRVDPARPAILVYTPVAGAPRLVGVAYALPLAAGEAPPPSPAPPDAWHTHAGGVDEESAALDHADAGPSATARLGLAVLHVWVWLPNPAGLFAVDNWALPFARAGLALPDDVVAPAEARGLSLAGGGDRHVAFLLASRLRLGDDEMRAAERVLAARRRAVERLVAGLPPDTVPSAAVRAALAAEWEGLWGDLADALAHRADEVRALGDRLR
jgi:hypothetical protein